ncbi:MAG: thioredoxin domain-containing protein [Patescibacteria group bacterium]|mgnify:FL=1
MSDEQQTPVTPAASTPSQASTALQTKDMLTPAAIVVAGLFVGVGLYFGDGASTAAQNVPAPAEQAAAATAATEKVDPISAEDHIKGNPDAPIKIVEYSDFDCPFCSRFHATMNTLVENSNGQIAWVYRHFPITGLHPNANSVALASLCVAELGGNDAFWTFADAYFEARGKGDKTPHETLIPQLVLQAGVNRTAFTSCFESGRHQSIIDEDLADVGETGGQGTPWSILIGPDGKTYPINGAVPQAAIEQLIDIAKTDAK